MRERDYYIFTDPHFGHDVMYRCGYREKGFEKIILDNIEKLPKNRNTVFICLGDFSFYKHKYWNEEYFKRTKGCLNWLVKGNHDKQKSDSWWLDRGWDFVGQSITLKKHKIDKIILTHKPVEVMAHESINIHGHLHEGTHHANETKEFLTNRHILISMELDHYKIRTLHEIVNAYKKRDTEWNR